MAAEDSDFDPIRDEAAFKELVSAGSEPEAAELEAPRRSHLVEGCSPGSIRELDPGLRVTREERSAVRRPEAASTGSRSNRVAGRTARTARSSSDRRRPPARPARRRASPPARRAHAATDRRAGSGRRDRPASEHRHSTRACADDRPSALVLSSASSRARSRSGRTGPVASRMCRESEQRKRGEPERARRGSQSRERDDRCQFRVEYENPRRRIHQGERRQHQQESRERPEQPHPRGMLPNDHPESDDEPLHRVHARRIARGERQRCCVTLMIAPFGSRTKNRRSPHSSSVIG